MFQDATLKPLLTEESYTLHGKEAQHFFINKCLKEIVSRSYIARRKQIEAQRKRSEQTDDKK